MVRFGVSKMTVFSLSRDVSARPGASRDVLQNAIFLSNLESGISHFVEFPNLQSGISQFNLSIWNLRTSA